MRIGKSEFPLPFYPATLELALRKSHPFTCRNYSLADTVGIGCPCLGYFLITACLIVKTVKYWILFAEFGRKRMIPVVFCVPLQSVSGEKSRADDAWLIESHLTEEAQETSFWNSSFIEQREAEWLPHDNIIALHTLWRVATLFVVRGSIPGLAPQVKCIRMASRHFCVLAWCASVKRIVSTA